MRSELLTDQILPHDEKGAGRGVDCSSGRWQVLQGGSVWSAWLAQSGL
ncbi:MAG: hypothetical protein JXA08_04170 [Methanomicrobiaceae archaeon]|nr:hypothetical protein [Methanomicrobiaceae archaeon]